MPKKNRKYQTSAAPDIDWLYAAYLERSKVYGYDLKELARIGDIEYGTMRKYNNQSPWQWPKPVREKIMNYLGIRVNITPTVGNVLEVRVT